MRQPTSRRCHQAGVSLVEVLVAMVILAIGLLSLVVLHGRLHVLQVESYQRSQALVILNDMSSRIQLNRNAAADYVTVDGPLGTDFDCDTIGTATRQQIDATEWCNALLGAAETLPGGPVGAMVGARACVENIAAGEYMVTVAWQGMAPLSAPPESVGCGAGLYGDAGTACAGDLCRRVVTTVVRIATLT